MRRVICGIVLYLATAFAFAGCNRGGADDKPLQPKPGAFNNDDPRAATAPAAPPITSVPAPGDMKPGGKRTTGSGPSGPAAPPPGSNN